MGSRERELFDLLEEVVASQGVNLVEVRLGSAPSRALLRIVIHSPGGITLADCAAVTKACGRALEGDPAAAGAYTLEVSSPGMDRVLQDEREFELFRGRRVRMWTTPDTAHQEILGKCAGVREGQGVVVETDDDREIVIPWSSVTKARLVPDGI